MFLLVVRTVCASHGGRCFGCIVPSRHWRLPPNYWIIMIHRWKVLATWLRARIRLFVLWRLLLRFESPRCWERRVSKRNKCFEHYPVGFQNGLPISSYLQIYVPKVGRMGWRSYFYNGGGEVYIWWGGRGRTTIWSLKDAHAGAAAALHVTAHAWCSFIFALLACHRVHVICNRAWEQFVYFCDVIDSRQQPMVLGGIGSYWGCNCMTCFNCLLLCFVASSDTLRILSILIWFTAKLLVRKSWFLFVVEVYMNFVARFMSFLSSVAARICKHPGSNCRTIDERPFRIFCSWAVGLFCINAISFGFKYLVA